MKRYHFSYFCFGLSLFAAFMSALTHQLGLLLINFFFAVWNWYTAEALRAKEHQNEENDHRDSDDSDNSSSTEDDSEDKE